MIRADAQYLVDLVGGAEITSTVVAENASMYSVARSFEVLVVGRVLVLAVAVLVVAVVFRERRPHCARKRCIDPSSPGAHRASDNLTLHLMLHIEQPFAWDASGDALVVVADDATLLHWSQR